MPVKHKFRSARPDSEDAGAVQPSSWNDTHELSGMLGVLDQLAPTGTPSATTVLYGDGAWRQMQAGAQGPVGSATPADGSVTTAKIADNAVTNAKIADGTITRDKLAPSLRSSQPADGNIVNNGAMEINQPNAGEVAHNNYAVDGWKLIDMVASALMAAQQVTDAPPGFRSSLKVTVKSVTGAPGPGDYVVLNQNIEQVHLARLLFGTAAAQNLQLGFWWKAHRTGQYSVSLSNYTGTRSIALPFTQSIADTWEWKTLSIPGDTLGGWNFALNAAALSLRFVIAAGSDWTAAPGSWLTQNLVGATGTVNAAASTDDTCQLTGVVLLAGNAPLPEAACSPLLIRPYLDELQLCRRYFEIVKFSNSLFGSSEGVGMTGGAHIPFLTEKRSAPTLTKTAGSQGSHATIGFDNITERGFRVNYAFVNATAAMAWADGYVITADART